MEEVTARLRALRDESYRAFTARLIPNMDPETILGVRMPLLRRCAKELFRTPEAEVFLTETPHLYLEENHLHAALIGFVRDFGRAMELTEAFLPYIDNWSVCDGFSPGVFRREPARLLERCAVWLESAHVYTRRFAIVRMLDHIGGEFTPEQAARVAAARTGAYYVDMAVAWYLSTALALRYEATLPLLEHGELDAWTHNKTIQKAVESFRVPPEHKAYLKTLRRKRERDGQDGLG